MKNFEKMTMKKLNALLTTATEEDKVAIMKELENRETQAVDEAPLTPEEEAAIKAAEENGGINPMYSPAKKQMPSNEERHTLAEKLATNIGHRCQVVPFNSIEWVDGYIAGIIEEKRTNKVLYAIKTDDGRRIVKVSSSALLKILDEVVIPEKKARTRKSKINEPIEKVEWTPEAIAEEVDRVIGNIGKTVEFEKYRTIDNKGEEHIEKTNGRIVAVLPEKRSQRLYYRILVPAPVEGNPLATKFVFKLTTASMTIAEEFDVEGRELNDKYCNRRKAAAVHTPLTPQDYAIRCEENLKKAEEKLRKVTEEFEKAKAKLEEAKAKLDAHLATQIDETPINGVEVDPLA